jgi:hypothetical protein
MPVNSKSRQAAGGFKTRTKEGGRKERRPENHERPSILQPNYSYTSGITSLLDRNVAIPIIKILQPPSTPKSSLRSPAAIRGNRASPAYGDKIPSFVPMHTLESIADRQSIEARISAVTSGDPRLWGKMSAHQMICHLGDAYLLPLGEKTASMATGFLQRTLIKSIALNLPMRWPKGLPTRPEMAQGVGGTSPTTFHEDRQKLLSALQRFCADSIDVSVPHPIFGSMSRREWLRWGYLHADHHLRQFGR